VFISILFLLYVTSYLHIDEERNDDFHHFLECHYQFPELQWEVNGLLGRGFELCHIFMMIIPSIQCIKAFYIKPWMMGYFQDLDYQVQSTMSEYSNDFESQIKKPI
jgi:hypothetical protein